MNHQELETIGKEKNFYNTLINMTPFIVTILIGVAFLVMAVWPISDEWMKDLEEGDDNFTDKW